VPGADWLNDLQARLEVAARRLKEAEGSGKNGRDWLVKELARVVLEADALKADSLRQKQALLEGHRKVGSSGNGDTQIVVVLLML